MPRFKPSRLECSLLLFPCALLLLTQLDNFRGLDAQSLSMTFIPFRRTREKKRMRHCQSNLKQLGLGLSMYVQDYDGKLPCNTSPSSNWAAGIWPYMMSGQIMRCPSDTFSAPLSHFAPVPSYWMNAHLNDKTGDGLELTSATSPARTLLFGDWGDGQAKSPFVLDERTWDGETYYAKRHLFGANYAFVDGHVKWLSNESVKTARFKSPPVALYSWQLK